MENRGCAWNEELWAEQLFQCLEQQLTGKPSTYRAEISTIFKNVMDLQATPFNSLYRKGFLRKEPHFGIVLKPLVHKHTKRSKNKLCIQLLREVQMVHYCLNEADISTYGTSSNGRI